MQKLVLFGTWKFPLTLHSQTKQPEKVEIANLFVFLLGDGAGAVHQDAAGREESCRRLEELPLQAGERVQLLEADVVQELRSLTCVGKGSIQSSNNSGHEGFPGSVKMVASLAFLAHNIQLPRMGES